MSKSIFLGFSQMQYGYLSNDWDDRGRGSKKKNGDSREFY